MKTFTFIILDLMLVTLIAFSVKEITTEDEEDELDTVEAEVDTEEEDAEETYESELTDEEILNLLESETDAYGDGY